MIGRYYKRKCKNQLAQSGKTLVKRSSVFPEGTGGINEYFS